MANQKPEQAFAVYHEGDLYVEGGRAIYKTIGAARGVITSCSKGEAESQWKANNPGGRWYELPHDQRDKLAEQYAMQHFTIMEYGPIKQVWPQ